MYLPNIWPKGCFGIKTIPFWENLEVFTPPRGKAKLFHSLPLMESEIFALEQSEI